MTFDPFALPESKDSNGFTLLPKGGYRVLIADVQFKYKQGDVNTNWFNARFDVLPYDGVGENEFEGRRIYNNFTWENANNEARTIGRQQLADLMVAAGAGSFSYPADLPAMLLNKEIFVEIYHSKRKDSGEMETRVGGYWSIDGKQRRQTPKPIPKAPTAAAIASAPAQAPRDPAGAYAAKIPAQGGSHAHPAFDPGVPF